MRIESRRSFVLAAVAAALLSACGGKKGSAAGEAVAPGSAVYGRIAVLGGAAYAAFSDQSNGGKLTVKRRGRDGWSGVGSAGFSAHVVDAASASIAIDPADGTPWIAFLDGGALTVAKLAGGDWALVGSPGFAQPAGRTVLVVSGGTPYLAFAGAGLDVALHVMTWSGAAWAELGPPLGAGAHPAFDVIDGKPTIAFDDGALNRIAVKRYDGGTWREVAHSASGVTIDEDWGQVLLSVNGVLHLAFGSAAWGAVVLAIDPGAPGGPALDPAAPGGPGLVSVGAPGSISGGHAVQAVSGAVAGGVLYVAFDDPGTDPADPQSLATVKSLDGSGWRPMSSVDACGLAMTTLAADPSDDHLYLGYSSCSGSMTVGVH